MSVTKQDDWLAQLPQVKDGIKVLLHTNVEYSVPKGRIGWKDERMIIEPVLEGKSGEFPGIGPAFSFSLFELIQIGYEDDDGARLHFGLSTRWLADLPKSYENSITLVCTKDERKLSIEKGWIEHDARKVFVREITGRSKCGLTLEHHDRVIEEISSIILIDRRTGEPMVFMRPTTKRPS